MTGAILEVRALRVAFRRAGRHPFVALDGVDFEVGPGETLALLGPSGSGKSTAIRAAARLLTPDAGCIRFQGVDIAPLFGRALRRARAGIQMVFQDPAGSLDPRWTIGASIEEPLGHLPRPQRRARAVEWCSRVGLPAAFLGRYPHELSGGQKQRAAIARALSGDPRVLLLDEPTSALDVSVRAQIVNLLCELRDARGLAMVLVTHDVAVARALADRVAVLDGGRVVEQGPTERVLAEPASAVARELVAAVPVLNPTAERLRLANS